LIITNRNDENAISVVIINKVIIFLT